MYIYTLVRNIYIQTLVRKVTLQRNLKCHSSEVVTIIAILLLKYSVIYILKSKQSFLTLREVFATKFYTLDHALCLFFPLYTFYLCSFQYFL